MKKDFMGAIIYLVLAIGCIVGAGEIQPPAVWHDALLIIGGIFLGGVCAEVTIIKMRKAGKTVLQ